MSDIKAVLAGQLLHLRSYLYVPASDERKLTRALESDADAVVADLEDAVSAPEKPRARELAVALLREAGGRDDGPALLVRVNGVDTEWWRDDLAAVAELDLAGIVLP